MSGWKSIFHVEIIEKNESRKLFQKRYIRKFIQSFLWTGFCCTVSLRSHFTSLVRRFPALLERGCQLCTFADLNAQTVNSGLAQQGLDTVGEVASQNCQSARAGGSFLFAH